MNQSPDEVMISFQKEDEEEYPDLSGKNAVKKIIKDVKDKIKTKKAKAPKKRKNKKDKIGAKNNDKKKEEIYEKEKKQEIQIILFQMNLIFNHQIKLKYQQSARIKKRKKQFKMKWLIRIINH